MKLQAPNSKKEPRPARAWICAQGALLECGICSFIEAWDLGFGIFTWYMPCSPSDMQTTQNPISADSVCPTAFAIMAEAKSPALSLLECVVPLV